MGGFTIDPWPTGSQFRRAMSSELHPEPGSPSEAVAVREVGQAGVDGNLAIQGIFVIIPVIAAARADTTPGAVALVGKVHA